MKKTSWMRWAPVLGMLWSCQGPELANTIDAEGAQSRLDTEEVSTDLQVQENFPDGFIGGSDVVARGNVACGKSLDGEWFCWGPNRYGIHGTQVPLNGLALLNKPTQPIVGLPGEPSDLVVGKRHACALIGSKAYCFGFLRAWLPEIGTYAPEPVYVPAPQEIAGEYLQLAAGDDFTCGIEKNREDHTKTNRVMCWGVNDKGQLGVGDTNPREPNVPQAAIGDTTGWLTLHLTRVTNIVAGANHVCALRDAHDNKQPAFYCWGANDKGQLGLGYFSANVSRPTRLENLSTLDNVLTASTERRISAYGDRTCALNRLGFVHCWGDNTNGEFGFVSPDLRRPLSTPTMVERFALSAGSYRNIAIGNRHQCVSRIPNGISAGVACWGAQDFGQLGATNANTQFPVVTPFVTAMERDAADLALGDDFTCISYANGAYAKGTVVRCFGRNEVGQLGLDIVGSQIGTPLAVRFPRKAP